MTVAEARLWKGFLQHLPYTVLRQKPLDNYIADFYCAKAKLVIEVDGAIHRTHEARAYDEERDAVLGGYGLTVMRFTNEMVEDNFGQVCAQIGRVLEERIQSGHSRDTSGKSSDMRDTPFPDPLEAEGLGDS